MKSQTEDFVHTTGAFGYKTGTSGFKACPPDYIKNSVVTIVKQLHNNYRILA